MRDDIDIDCGTIATGETTIEQKGEEILTYLLEDKKASPMVRLAPHIIFRSNLPLFADRLDDLADSEQP